MNIRYFDAHCHLQFYDYAADSGALIARMRDEGVAGIIVGVDRESSEKAITLAEKHEHLFAAVGIHPNNREPFSTDVFRLLAKKENIVAIGECGLDYYRAGQSKEVQQESLRAHIALAAELDKPLIIHCRPSFAKASEGKPSHDAYHDLISMLKEAKTAHGEVVRGDIHFFVGGAAEAEALIALGFTVSFTAVITFARDYDAVIRAVPLASILCETDAPYVAPASRRGKRNDPLAVVEVALKIAEIRSEDPEAVRAALLANARRLFVPDHV